MKRKFLRATPKKRMFSDSSILAVATTKQLTDRARIPPSLEGLLKSPEPGKQVGRPLFFTARVPLKLEPHFGSSPQVFIH